MKTFALVTQKGGSGKSTLTRSLAVAAQEGGEKVVIVDLDRQKTLSNWNERRQAETPIVMQAKPSELKDGLAALGGEGYSVCFLDTAGIDQPSSTEATRLAGCCVMPVQPSIDDLESCLVTAARLKQLRKPLAFVVNMAEPQLLNGANRELVQALEEWSNGKAHICQQKIIRRVAHREAAKHGLGVSEYEPSGKAAREIRNLWKEINLLVDEKQKPRKPQTKRTKEVANV